MKYITLITVFLLGCSTPSVMTLEEAKKVDERLKNDDWKKDYIMICETFGSQKKCRYVSRIDMEQYLRTLSF